MRRAARAWLLGVMALAPTFGRAAAPRPLAPVFIPGLYQTETRTSAAPEEGIKRTDCLASIDYDAFRRETIARYLKQPQFTKVCSLSAAKPIAGGFAFAMDCDGAKSIIAYEVAKGFVSSTTRTIVAARPEYSSTILTLSRRVGDCKGRTPPGNAP